jgi:16S rRNA (uracil1498-N3)-methyltransferase
MTAPLFLATTETLDAERVVLDGPEGRHAADVRRLQPGEAIDLSDGAGLLLRGLVAEVTRGRVVVDVRERVAVPAPLPRFVVVQAVAKGGRDTNAVEAMTEVGVDEVVGWQAERSVARWSERAAARWSATAREAAKQARRPWVPAVSGPVDGREVAERLRAAALAVVLHEDATEPLAGTQLPVGGDVVLVVGPEGGITERELDAFRAAGARVCRLGAPVLRTSTAGVAALSVLSAAARWH